MFKVTDVTLGTDTIELTLPAITAEGPMIVDVDRDTQFDFDGVRCALHANQRVFHGAVIAPP